MKGTPTYGWVRLDQNGFIDWSTFTTEQKGSGWLFTYRLQCQCGADMCGEKLNSQTNHFFNTIINDTEEGVFSLHFYYDTKPVRFVVLHNSVEVFDSGYGGLSAYQVDLDNFLSMYGLPAETINPSPAPYTEFAVDAGDTVEIQVISMAINPAMYWFSYGCIDDGSVDCILSQWSAWSTWTDNGDGTETRVRTRTIIQSPQGNGEPCGTLIDQETRQKISQDCVLSPWQPWSQWTNNPDGTQSRTRYRTVVTPPSNGGQPCGALSETETRLIPQDCVMGEWSVWSQWSYIGNGKEQRSRTRQVITPATEGGIPCEETVQTETRDAAIPFTVIFQAEDIDDEYRIQNAFVGDNNGSINIPQDFNITAAPTSFTGNLIQNVINISFHQEILTQRDGIRTRITIKNGMGVTISSDEEIDLSNFSKILQFTGEDSITLKIQIFN